MFDVKLKQYQILILIDLIIISYSLCLCFDYPQFLRISINLATSIPVFFIDSSKSDYWQWSLRSKEGCEPPKMLDVGHIDQYHLLEIKLSKIEDNYVEHICMSTRTWGWLLASNEKVLNEVKQLLSLSLPRFSAERHSFVLYYHDNL